MNKAYRAPPKLPIGNIHVCTKRPCVHLTPKDAALLHFLADGLSSSEIAYRQKVSVNTVKNQLTRMFYRFGVNSRTALVAYGFRAGFFK